MMGNLAKPAPQKKQIHIRSSGKKQPPSISPVVPQGVPSGVPEISAQIRELTFPQDALKMLDLPYDSVSMCNTMLSDRNYWYLFPYLGTISKDKHKDNIHMAMEYFILKMEISLWEPFIKLKPKDMAPTITIPRVKKLSVAGVTILPTPITV